MAEEDILKNAAMKHLLLLKQLAVLREVYQVALDIDRRHPLTLYLSRRIAIEEELLALTGVSAQAIWGSTI